MAIRGFTKKVFLTPHTHLWARKAHEYWAEDSDLCLLTGHLEVTFYLTYGREVIGVKGVSASLRS